jgi:hypoxanthine phosphoribosyltransferase
MRKILVGSIEYETPTWNQIYTMLLAQTEKIQKNTYKPDIILGIARGGIIPASILADLLTTRQVTTIRIEFYKGIAKPSAQPILKQPLYDAVAINGKKILIVDDISDSGKSLKLAKQHLTEKNAAEIKIATLYAKSTTQTLPDYVEKITDRWVVFPWELKETLQSIVQNQKDRQSVNNEIDKLVKAGVPKRFLEQILKTLQEAQR